MKMGPRWKGKIAELKDLADPVSNIVSQLQCSLIKADACGLLSGSSVLLAVQKEQTDLFNRSCFGRPILTAEKDKQWFQLGLEEAFYLCYSLKCLKIVGGDNCPKTYQDLWEYMKSIKPTFPYFYKAYSHLRNKNWVVRTGSQYGVDFVADRHHPALIHSEYAVLVFSEEVNSMYGRLKVWSDYYCTILLCGSVAKTLLVLNINTNDDGTFYPSCFEAYSVEERTITRWSPEQCHDDQTVTANGTKSEILLELVDEPKREFEVEMNLKN
ncbi:tRNA-splicing endonuclease subunit Sen2-1-like isoform X1 [Tripterygium wilfordii]|uniref:tRNA-intron lyase n=1 Tax=Tripterygium wilfordii TaxID=458696 RepID=A0A7J7C004_TRIWF|nr:tRNA-splicing endonuclease subunit Sen2-1-like [Tripterygium wilfordii]KAF5727428.1 tRNA-splicing endonuclease subunit Sen2-1-like isoform X1 [Tripterygium wilfordii]